MQLVFVSPGDDVAIYIEKTLDMGNLISLNDRGGRANITPASQQAVLMHSKVTAIGAKITRICAAPRTIIDVTVMGERWKLSVAHADMDTRKEVRDDRRQFAEDLIASTYKGVTPPEPATLSRLAARAYVGKISNLGQLDRLVTRLYAWDLAHDGVTAALMEGSGDALRDAIRAAKSDTTGTPATKLTLAELDALEVVAVKAVGVPRVLEGENCEQVLDDLDIRAGSRAQELLQDFAVFGPGMVRVARGEDWRTVYQSLGVDDMRDYHKDLLDSAAICQGMARVSRGEKPGKTCTDISNLMRNRHIEMLHNPEKWDTEYREEIKIRQDMMAAAADPEGHYKAVVEDVFGK